MMRIAYFILALAITITIIVILDRPLGSVPPIGRFISPQHGFWQNAEPVNKSYSADIEFAGLNNSANVYFDDRLVPHVFAEDENDAWFVQGYLHARFRLWQMEFQTYAAAGRLSEILGPGPDSAYLNNDRNMRRVGMVYGAKRSLQEIEKDSLTGKQINAYTAGVNSYIDQLTTSQLPLEYRLLNYSPEHWTNLKTALFLKYMSYDLTGYETDIEYTNARSFFSAEDYNKLYPVYNEAASPIVSKGTAFAPSSMQPVAPLNADSVYFKNKINIVADKTDKDNGSNNWVAGGSKTKSGRPILCNDPHLGLNLPSLWYEMQITTPSFSTYGVSFPGAPAIIIGFNEHIAWGVTNAARDVRDYYSIQFKDDSKSQYLYNNEWKNTELTVEEYKMKDGSVYYDTVAYTVFGPVMYDDHYNGNRHLKNNSSLAVRWRAHDPSNELKTFALLDRAKDYHDYEHAISTFICPGQNFAFAAKTGDIAIWHQGSFPAKWYQQGDFVMPGTDSSYAWQGFIPQQENPHDINPSRGFVSSANQWPTDTTYPYYTGGHYDLYRGIEINRRLEQMNAITPEDMQALQNDNYNVFAEYALPFLVSHISENKLSDKEKSYLNIIKNWKYNNDKEEKGPSVFTTWVDQLEKAVWDDELIQLGGSYERPEQFTLIDDLKKDSSFSFIDNISTEQKETLEDIVTASFQKTVELLIAAGDERVTWNKFKDAGIRHLLRLEPLSRYHLNTGGGVNIVNATKQFHGPSWKMIVQLTDEVEAYGIYPGGQNGNPGSKYYDIAVDDWAAGKHYKLWFMKKEEVQSDKIKHIMTFNRL
jgi:penicillin G amidase